MSVSSDYISGVQIYYRAVVVQITFKHYKDIIHVDIKHPVEHT